MLGLDGVRGQILSWECIMAVFIFTLVLATVFFLWDTTSANIMRAEILYGMDSASNDVVEKLLRTPGVPMDWDGFPVENVSSLGLVDDSRVLDSGKLLRFVDLMEDAAESNLTLNPCYDAIDSPDVTKYECNKYLLGLGRYNFEFKVFDLTGDVASIYGVNCSTGRPPIDEDFLITLSRSALLNGEVVGVQFKVWA